MSGLIFLCDVIAFVVVAYWFYATDARGRSENRGLLGMKPSRPSKADEKSRPGPAWRQSPGPAGGKAAKAAQRGRGRRSWELRVPPDPPV